MEEFELQWSRLTALPKKEALFAEDSFFREGIAEARHAWNDHLWDHLHGTALVLFKPDAIAGRRVPLAVRTLLQRGFFPVAALAARLDAPTSHALWRYQLRRNTLDKIRLYTRWAAQLPSLLVAFGDGSRDSTLPASVRLKSMKGHAIVEKRREQDLRTILGSPNTIVNFMHSADEPADVAREIAIFVPARLRRSFLAAIEKGNTAHGTRVVRRLVRRLHRDVPVNDIDARAAGARIIAAARAAESTERVQLERVTELIDSASSGAEPLSLRALEEALGGGLEHVDPVDMFIFGAQFVERNRVGERGDLDEDCVPHWLARPSSALGCAG